MALKNKNAKRRLARSPCVLCGTVHVVRDCAHIVDEVQSHGVPGDWNILSLCPSCHRLFEDVLRPKLYLALQRFGAVGLPASWSQSNKHRVSVEGRL